MILLIELLLGGLIIIFVIHQLFYNHNPSSSETINIVCDDSKFRDVIIDVLARLDSSVKYHLRNTSIVLLDEPLKVEISVGHILLGMHKTFKYQPDKIELYKNNILLFAKKPGSSLQQCIETTLLHEIGHHFQFDHEKLSSLGL